MTKEQLYKGKRLEHHINHINEILDFLNEHNYRDQNYGVNTSITIHYNNSNNFFYGGEIEMLKVAFQKEKERLEQELARI